MERNVGFENLFFGCIMGDGYLVKGNNSDFTFSFQHSTKQEEYALYKLDLFKENCEFPYHIYRFLSSKIYPAIRINIRLPKEYFLYLRHLVYPNGNKIVTRNILNRINDVGLSLWYQDDGNLSVLTRKNDKRTSRYIKLSTHSYTQQENIIISDYFMNVWNVRTNVRTEKKKYFFNGMGAIEGKKLFSIIRPYIHPSMYYKIDMKYKTSDPRSIQTDGGIVRSA